MSRFIPFYKDEDLLSLFTFYFLLFTCYLLLVTCYLARSASLFDATKLDIKDRTPVLF